MVQMCFFLLASHFGDNWSPFQIYQYQAETISHQREGGIFLDKQD